MQAAVALLVLRVQARHLRRHVRRGQPRVARPRYERRARAPTTPLDARRAGGGLFVEFCTEDPARYQLLFQRTIPGFEPSPESYAIAVEVVELGAGRLAALGLTDPAPRPVDRAAHRPRRPADRQRPRRGPLGAPGRRRRRHVRRPCVPKHTRREEARSDDHDDTDSVEQDRRRSTTVRRWRSPRARTSGCSTSSDRLSPGLVKPTDCEGWDVKAAGVPRARVDGEQRPYRDFMHQYAAAQKRAAENGRPMIDGMNEVQVARARRPHAGGARRADCPTIGPRPGPGPQRCPAVMRRHPCPVPAPLGEEQMEARLPHRRDLHPRHVDAPRRPLPGDGHELDLTPEHDGRLVGDVVAEWARRHGRPFTLHLDGPAGGTFVQGERGESSASTPSSSAASSPGGATGTGLLDPGAAVLMETTRRPKSPTASTVCPRVPDVAPPGSRSTSSSSTATSRCCSTPARGHVPARVRRRRARVVARRAPALDHLRPRRGRRVRRPERVAGRGARTPSVAHGIVRLHGLPQRPRRPAARARWPTARSSTSAANGCAGIDTPHVPHGWEAGSSTKRPPRHCSAETSSTHLGDGRALTDDDIVGPPPKPKTSSATLPRAPHRAPPFAGSADLAPTTLALMHGASFRGDGAKALSDLANAYETQFLTPLR